MLTKCGEGLGATIDEDHPGRRGIEGVELSTQAAGRQFADLTRQLDPGRPGPDNHKGQPFALLDRVADHLGHLEGPEYPTTQLDASSSVFMPGA